jgi:hypothetical protein
VEVGYSLPCFFCPDNTFHKLCSANLYLESPFRVLAQITARLAKGILICWLQFHVHLQSRDIQGYLLFLWIYTLESDEDLGALDFGVYVECRIVLQKATMIADA